MPLSIQDALLFALIIVWMCVVIAEDMAAYATSDQRKLSAANSSGAETPPFFKTSEVLRSQQGREPLTQTAPPRASAIPVLPRVADLLIVDDSAVARAKLRRLFVQSGYEVHLASDGVEALERLRTGWYSLMITDLEMPNMDGISLIHECLRRPETSRMPVIAVSAHENLRAKFNECRDICGVHRKPWADDILLSHVATLIGARGQAGKGGMQRLPLAA